MADVRPRSLNDLALAERFQLLIEAVHDYAIYLIDAEGHVATWNPGAMRFKGYTAEEIIGQHFSVFYTPSEREADVPAKALRVARENGRFEAEGWRVRKDGSRFWAHVVIDPVFGEDGRPLGFAKITRDVTERREVERALREAEQRFSLLVQGVRDYAIYMLSPDGLVTNWNAGAEAIKGYTADEIIGQHFSIFYTPEDRAADGPQRALQTALTKGKFESEALRVRKGGERFWAQVLIDPIRDDQGVLIGFAKVTRDITEKRRAEEELERSRAALAQAQKMEAIGRLTGGVAHDFNNLLTVIRASADFLRRPNLDEAKRARYVEAIAETANRAAVLTSQLLAFARRQPLQPEVFDVAARLRGLQHIITTTLGSSIGLKLDLPEGPHLALADPSQFDTAILNMVVNARDAMERGGRLELSVGGADGVPAVRGHAAARGDFVAIRVADTGTGIGHDAMQRIFEPFFTTKAVDKGTGLGLSQVYGFAKQSRGEIDVESELGVGTTFILYLPRAFGAASAPAAQPRALGDLPSQSILLVEDNQGVGEFAANLLRELGQRVTWSGDGQEALKILEARREDFDLVFSDIVMPGISGVELARTIRRRWPDLRVVLTSGYSHALVEDSDHGFPLVQKPYSIEALLEALR